jgi:hypothetical protein
LIWIWVKCTSKVPRSLPLLTPTSRHAHDFVPPNFSLKIRWRTSIGKQRDLSLLGNLIRRKFSSDGSTPLIVMGDKSAQTIARFHAPTKGVRLRCQLHRLGFRVLLLDEYRTSSSCPDCQGNTTRTNIKRVNPRPWQRRLRAETFVHGLLECQSTQCKSECDGHGKKWNRDLTALCNFRWIWDAYLNGRERPNDLKVATSKRRW